MISCEGSDPLSPGAPATATWDDVLGSLRALIIAVADLVPEQDLTNAWELVDADEPGVALENLCTQLYEYDAVLTPAVREQIHRLAAAMRMDPELLLEGLAP